jgi:dethiobiotin synthetase
MRLFVTGTDTGCGKTHVSAGLVAAAARSGRRALGMKPVASGASRDAAGVLVNEDVEALARASSVSLPRSVVNPYCLELPASPHLAAAAAGIRIAAAPILAAYRQCIPASEVLVVEGVGGWCVPLAPDLWIADLARQLALPVLLVVGIKLGCINHALLTVRQMIRDGSTPCAWIANVLEPEMVLREGVLSTLENAIPAPLAGVLDWLPLNATDAHAAAFDALVARLASLVSAPGD